MYETNHVKAACLVGLDEIGLHYPIAPRRSIEDLICF